MASSLCCVVNEICISCCKRNLSSRDGFLVSVGNLGNSQFGFFRNGGSKLLSSRKYFSLKTVEKSVTVVEDSEEYSFTVSYLINSCGLSPKLAISASKKVKFTTPDRPDSVLAILKNYGFENTHIAKLVGKDPTLLLARPETSLIPKLDFFRSMGLSDCELAKICSSCPNMFRYSLEKRIIPCCEFLKSVLHDDTKVASALKGGPRIFESDVQLYALNLEILKQMGASLSVISYILISFPSLLHRNIDKFTVGVKEVIRLGIKPSRLTFVQALLATTLMSESKWEKKLKVYSSWGCSKNDISIAFRKFPICMLVSEKKIMSGMDFLVNKLGLESTDVMRNPSLLTYSFKKRLIPRCSVVRVLQLKGLLKKDSCFATSMQLSEKHFLDRFVTKYEEEVPELLSVYQGEVGLRELGFGPEDIHRRIAEL